MDSDEFRIYGKQMVDYIADYISNIRQNDVLPSVEPGYLQKLLPDSAPTDSVSFQQTMDQVEKAILPGITHWHHPNFYAFYPTAFSFPSILGSMLSDGFGINGLSWQSSPACTELEVLVLDWMVKAMEMPEKFLSSSENGGGIILSSASEASVMVLLVERNIAINKIQQEQPHLGSGAIVDKMVVYFSKQAHSSVERACKLSLLNYKFVATNDDEAMDVEDLSRIVAEDRKEGLIPLMVILAFGSTSLCAFDSLYEVGKTCLSLDVKCHVDAAYGGASLICPEYRYLLKGVEYVNSFCFNPHKLLKTHFDCSVLWTDNRIAASKTFSECPLYLAHDLESKTSELRNWQISLGRRFRALKLWFVLNMFGMKNLQESIRKHANLAKLFEVKLNQSEIFEVVNNVQFGLVCFRLKGNNEKTRQLLDILKQDHSIFLSPSILEKRDLFFLRLACSAHSTEEDVVKTYNKIYAAAEKLL